MLTVVLNRGICPICPNERWTGQKENGYRKKTDKNKTTCSIMANAKLSAVSLIIRTERGTEGPQPGRINDRMDTGA